MLSSDSGKIEICIPKTEESVRWPRIFEEVDTEGEEIVDDSVVEEIHQRLSHLTSDEMVKLNYLSCFILLFFLINIIFVIIKVSRVL